MKKILLVLLIVAMIIPSIGIYLSYSSLEKNNSIQEVEMIEVQAGKYDKAINFLKKIVKRVVDTIIKLLKSKDGNYCKYGTNSDGSCKCSSSCPDNCLSNGECPTDGALTTFVRTALNNQSSLSKLPSSSSCYSLIGTESDSLRNRIRCIAAIQPGKNRYDCGGFTRLVVSAADGSWDSKHNNTCSSGDRARFYCPSSSTGEHFAIVVDSDTYVHANWHYSSRPKGESYGETVKTNKQEILDTCGKGAKLSYCVSPKS